MNFEETTLSSKKVFDGKLLNVFLDKVRIPNGKEATREYIKHPGAVAVVPIQEDGKILLVRQFRYPAKKIFLEVPAGKLDKDEHPDHCVIRELEEETGYVAGTLKKMASIYTTPGFTDEVIHLYVAKQLVKTSQRLDEDEFLSVESYSVDEIRDMLGDGRISDAKTMLALLLTGV